MMKYDCVLFLLIHPLKIEGKGYISMRYKKKEMANIFYFKFKHG